VAALGEQMPMKVVAALIREGDRLLVCQRRGDGSFPFKWEFPGGKVEDGEGCPEALRRELKEELGIDIQSAAEIFQTRHLYPGPLDVALVFFRVDYFRGAVVNHAFQQLRWVSVHELKDLDFLEGDLALIEKLVCGKLRV